MASTDVARREDPRTVGTSTGDRTPPLPGVALERLPSWQLTPSELEAIDRELEVLEASTRQLVAIALRRAAAREAKASRQQLELWEAIAPRPMFRSHQSQREWALATGGPRARARYVEGRRHAKR